MTEEQAKKAMPILKQIEHYETCLTYLNKYLPCIAIRAYNYPEDDIINVDDECNKIVEEHVLNKIEFYKNELKNI